jgi:hypothetical protein
VTGQMGHDVREMTVGTGQRQFTVGLGQPGHEIADRTARK